MLGGGGRRRRDEEEDEEEEEEEEEKREVVEAVFCSPRFQLETVEGGRKRERERERERERAMGCLLSKLYDKSLRARAGRRSMKYRLNDEANLDTETNSLRPTPVSVPDFSSSNTASNNKKKAGDQPKKEYSWDKRRKLDPKDFMCTNTEDEVVVKKSGKINGQQFVIDNCKR